MPLKDGREALKEIKANAKLNHLEIIIFSTSASEEDKTQLLKMGAKSYIVKPSDPEKLTEIFGAICEGLIVEPGWQYMINQKTKKQK
jgi:DNA-binding response OmpR family regulator